MGKVILMNSDYRRVLGFFVPCFCSAVIEHSAAVSRRDEKWAIKATVRHVMTLRQLLSYAPCQALSITLLLLADIHTPITD